MQYKNKVGLMVFSLILILLMQCTNYVFASPNKLILIDPGHGGIDGGAVSPSKVLEKDINLSISLKVKEELLKQGFKVIMTREEDKGLYEDKGSIRDKYKQNLANRCKMKEESGCDLFISIHLNKFPQSQYYGAQVWYSNNQYSMKLAQILQKNLIEDLDKNNKRVQKCAKDDIKVLSCKNDIPSALVECGFLSNKQEEEKLKDENYQNKIAQSITKSIIEYYKNN